MLTTRQSDSRVARSVAREHPRPTICHVLHSLQVGGGEVLARDFAQANASSFRPVFALLDEMGTLGHKLRRDRHVVEVIGRRPGFDWSCVRRLRHFLNRENVSLIHAHQYGPLLYSAVARLPRARSTPILFTEHGRDHPDFRRRKRVWANRLLLSARDRFVAVGKGVRQALVDYEGLSEWRVEVIYNGRDLSAYDPRRPLRDEVRKEMGVPENAFAIMTVARLNRLKDHPTALRAMERLRTAHPHATLILVGDGEDRPQLEQMVKDLDLEQHVRFLGSRNDVPRLLQAADAFLLSSISEGIPLTLIEAMATGLPCVATRVGGVPEVIVNEKTGFLAEPSDAEGLASLCARLIEHPKKRIDMGRKGCARVSEMFDGDAMHATYRQLYMEMTE